LGYLTVEQKDDDEQKEIGNIAIDASFSPVLNVAYEIEDIRVGEITNYDKLTIDLLTDGTIDAETAISQASSILSEHFNMFLKEEKEEKKETKKKESSKKEDK